MSGLKLFLRSCRGYSANWSPKSLSIFEKKNSRSSGRMEIEISMKIEPPNASARSLFWSSQLSTLHKTQIIELHDIDLWFGLIPKPIKPRSGQHRPAKSNSPHVNWWQKQHGDLWVWLGLMQEIYLEWFGASSETIKTRKFLNFFSLNLDQEKIYLVVTNNFRCDLDDPTGAVWLKYKWTTGPVLWTFCRASKVG